MRDEVVFREKTFVSAVVYIHNNAEQAGEAVSRLLDTLERSFEYSEVVCVDDASSDGSGEVIKNAVKERESIGGSSVTLLTLGTFGGVEEAMTAGDVVAIGDFVLEVDSTITDYEDSLILDVYHKAKSGFDIVSAVPVGKGLLTSKLFYKVLSKYAKTHEAMTTERFRILSRRALNRVLPMGVSYRKVLYALSGLSQSKVTYKPIENNRRLLRAEEKHYRKTLAVDSLLLFTGVGCRLAVMMASIMAALAICVTVYSIAVYLTHSPVQGWTTTMLLLSLSFFGLFSLMAICLRYLGLITDLVFKRKWTAFKSIEKLPVKSAVPECREAVYRGAVPECREAVYRGEVKVNSAASSVNGGEK